MNTLNPTLQEIFNPHGLTLEESIDTPFPMSYDGEAYIVRRPSDNLGAVQEVKWFHEAEKELVEYFGFEVHEDGAETLISVPTVERLNEQKESVPDSTGLNRAKFVEYDGSRLPRDEYLTFIAEGSIPVAQTDFMLHDVSGHALGWLLMGADMHQRIMGICKKAIGDGDPERKEAALRLADGISAGLTLGRGKVDRRELALGYAEASKGVYLLAGMHASKDIKQHEAALESVKTFVENI